MIDIHLYQPTDRSAILQLMTELQSHVAAIDPLHRLKTTEDFDEDAYVDHLLEQTKSLGVIFIAKDEHAAAGFIAGVISDEDPDDTLDHYSAKEGKILELVVSKQHRGGGIGRELMEKMEEYFREKDCEYIRVGCFAPNTGTHAFYEKCGYADRYLEMLKLLS